MFLTLTLLTGCKTLSDADATRSLPPAPASMQPVPMPKRNADARISVFDHRAALAKANKRLVNSLNWYLGVRADYAGAKK